MDDQMPQPRPSSPWDNPVFDVCLRELFVKGLSFSQIAAALSDLGHKFSRNATIGRAKRLHLPARPPRGNTNPKPKATHEGKRFVPGRGLAKVAPWKPAVDAMPTPSAAGPFLGVSLVDLAPQTCRYPEGEGSGIRFCGQPARLDSSYCEHHHKICVIVRSVR